MDSTRAMTVLLLHKANTGSEELILGSLYRILDNKKFSFAFLLVAYFREKVMLVNRIA